MKERLLHEKVKPDWQFENGDPNKKWTQIYYGMKTDNLKAADIDEFISLYPREVQEKLQKLRRAIRKAAPNAEEAIKYGMPTFVLNGNLVHFSAWKTHIGFYPRLKAFEKELSAYEGGKGTVKFPIDKPLPLRLIEKMVRFRAKANKEKMNGKAK